MFVCPSVVCLVVYIALKVLCLFVLCWFYERLLPHSIRGSLKLCRRDDVICEILVRTSSSGKS